jgi:hypothetical protein
MAYPTDGKIGLDFERRTTTAEHTLGTTARASGNRKYIYGISSGTVAIGTCTLTGTTITDTAGSHTADTAFAASEYGWVYTTAGDV